MASLHYTRGPFRNIHLASFSGMNKPLELNPDFIPDVAYVKLEWKGRKWGRGGLGEEKEQQHQEMGRGIDWQKEWRAVLNPRTCGVD